MLAIRLPQLLTTYMIVQLFTHCIILIPTLRQHGYRCRSRLAHYAAAAITSRAKLCNKNATRREPAHKGAAEAANSVQ